MSRPDLEKYFPPQDDLLLKEYYAKQEAYSQHLKTARYEDQSSENLRQGLETVYDQMSEQGQGFAEDTDFCDNTKMELLEEAAFEARARAEAGGSVPTGWLPTPNGFELDSPRFLTDHTAHVARGMFDGVRCVSWGVCHPQGQEVAFGCITTSELNEYQKLELAKSHVVAVIQYINAMRNNR